VVLDDEDEEDSKDSKHSAGMGPEATSVWGLKLLVYEDEEDSKDSKHSAGMRGLKLPVYEALSY
jgi:hypothetical protein